MHVGLFNRPFVPLKLMSKSWQLCSFRRVPDFPSPSVVAAVNFVAFSCFLLLQEKTALRNFIKLPVSTHAVSSSMYSTKMQLKCHYRRLVKPVLMHVTIFYVLLEASGVNLEQKAP